MSPEAFVTAVRRMAEVPGGSVVVSDYYVSERRPYRYAAVNVLVAHAEAPARAAELLTLAISIDGHMTIATHYSTEDGGGACQIGVSLSHELDEEDLRKPAAQSLPVSLNVFGVEDRS